MVDPAEIGLEALTLTMSQQLMAVGHDYYKKAPMKINISHEGVCIFMLVVLLSCKRQLNKNLKAQLQDKNIAISELKKLIDKMKGKSMETMFDKPSVIRQPNAFKCQKQSILDFASKVNPVQKKTNVIAPGMYKVHIRPNQTRTTQLPQEIRITNKCMSFSTRVIPTTSVSRPPLKSTQLKDRVLHNNSQGKKQEVEDHRRIFKFSNNKTSITVCNDSLNVKTSNVNFVCVTYGKCVLNDNHDFCVLHYINGMNSRTKKLIVVPITTRCRN
ncbi:hypothetical protein Tco_0374242 [Tanacetum coccineum]